MLEGVLKLGQFVTDKFGLPGAMAVGLAVYLIYLLREERLAHASTRDKIDVINEKRIEFTSQTLNTVKNLNEALVAIEAILGKPR